MKLTPATNFIFGEHNSNNDNASGTSLLLTFLFYYSSVRWRIKGENSTLYFLIEMRKREGREKSTPRTPFYYFTQAFFSLPVNVTSKFISIWAAIVINAASSDPLEPIRRCSNLWFSWCT